MAETENKLVRFIIGGAKIDNITEGTTSHGEFVINDSGQLELHRLMTVPVPHSPEYRSSFYQVDQYSCMLYLSIYLATRKKGFLFGYLKITGVPRGGYDVGYLDQIPSSYSLTDTGNSLEFEDFLTNLDKLDGLFGAKYFVALDRLVRAVTPRTDTKGEYTKSQLIDNIIVWENLFGDPGDQLSFRISGAIAWSLERSDANRRLRLFRIVKKIYDFRSSMIHGKRIVDDKELIKIVELATRINLLLLTSIADGKLKLPSPGNENVFARDLLLDLHGDDAVDRDSAIDFDDLNEEFVV